MKTPSKALLLLALSVSLNFLPAKAADWSQWRGPDRNGISTETGWTTNWPEGGPKQLWKTNVGMGFSCVSVSQGRLYTQGAAGTNNTDTIFCLDAATGSQIWTNSYPCDLGSHFYPGGTSATPTVDGDKVYTISKWGDLFCFDAAKGTVIWSKNIIKEFGFPTNEWGFASSPLIQGDMLLLNAGKSGSAFNKKTGEIIWSSEKSRSGYANVVPFKSGGDDCLAVFGYQTLEAVKMADGKPLWSYPWKNSSSINAGDPIISDGKMYFSSGYGKGSTLLDITKEKPETVWENKNICNKFDVPILWKGCIYCSEEQKRGQLKCVDWNTGEVKWAEPSMGQGGITIADGKLIVLSEKGELVVAEATPDGFNPTVRAKVLSGTCWTTPVLSNGRIYCRNGKGDLVCVDVSGK